MKVRPCATDEEVTDLELRILAVLPADWNACCLNRALNNAVYLWRAEKATREAAAETPARVQ